MMLGGGLWFGLVGVGVETGGDRVVNVRFAGAFEGGENEASSAFPGELGAEGRTCEFTGGLDIPDTT